MSLDGAFDLVLVGAAFAGALVTAFSGFAFSPVAGAILMTVAPAKTLIPTLMMCSLLVQVVVLVSMRRSLTFRGLGPMLIGGALGAPLAVLLLRRIDLVSFQLGFGLFLAAYAGVMLWRPLSARPSRPRSRAVEGAVGLLGGLVGGLTAMPGAAPVLYCDATGVGKEAQRATVQPFIFAMQALSLALMALGGDIDPRAVHLVVGALPGLAIGVVAGLALFGRAPEAAFRRVVLLLLLATGLALAARPQPAASALPGADGSSTLGATVVAVRPS